jgi:putative hydrolase of the HAD superfamily
MDLNQIWRNAICTRKVFPETKPTILGLHQSGYRIGLVSNTTSSIDVPITLKKEGIADCFEVVILSCVIGIRKPSPGILIEAVNRMGILPEKCAYIGDRTDWDVCAARGAGFGRTIILRNPLKPSIGVGPADQTPDQFIDNLLELLNIFPPKNEYN